LPAKLTDLETARDLVLDRARPLGGEPVALHDARGRVLAEDVISDEPVPGFDNSAMDGFAVRSADTAAAAESSPVVLRLVGESRAGVPAATELAQGEAIAISTGAVVPAGADAVVPVERAISRDGSVELVEAVPRGRHLRRAGEDVEPGQTVISRGTRIRPAELGVLASVGRESVLCSKRPAVAVLTTGDELVPPGSPLRPGEIRNSNAYSIPALAEAAGAPVVAVETVGDDPAATAEAVGRILEADVAVVCGGVSVGEHDHVRPALAELGVREVFWGIALKPGKPTWFGTRGEGNLVFGLPGNPVSAMVTFMLLVRPALAVLSGADPSALRGSGVLDEDLPRAPNRTHAVRCRLSFAADGWHLRSTGAQGSHVLTSMLGADCVAILPADGREFRAGERVEFELLDDRAGGGLP